MSKQKSPPPSKQKPPQSEKQASQPEKPQAEEMKAPQPGETPPQAFFGMEKVYIRDVSYEAPDVPAGFLENKPPEISMQLALQHRAFETKESFYEVVLTIQIIAKREDITLFLVEVQQAGVFQIRGVADEALERTLEITCPYVLLPFAREAISDLIGKGGFPQLLINPINFDALYEQKRERQQEQVVGTA